MRTANLRGVRGECRCLTLALLIKDGGRARLARRAAFDLDRKTTDGEADTLRRLNDGVARGSVRRLTPRCEVPGALSQELQADRGPLGIPTGENRHEARTTRRVVQHRQTRRIAAARFRARCRAEWL